MFTQTFFIYTFYKALQQPAKVEVRSRDAKQRLPATVLFCKILSVSFHTVGIYTWKHFKTKFLPPPLSSSSLKLCPST